MEPQDPELEASPTSQAPSGLRAVALDNKRLSERDSKSAKKHGHWANRIRLVAGSVGLLAGIVAGTAAIGESRPLLAGFAAFIAAFAAGLLSFLNPERHATKNWTRAAALRALSQRWSALANAAEEPTKQEIDELLDEYKQLHAG
jgi:hypothetical protein